MYIQHSASNNPDYILKSTFIHSDVVLNAHRETPLQPIRKIDSLRKELSIKSFLLWTQFSQSLPDSLNPHLHFLLAAEQREDGADRSEQREEAERG